MTKWILIFYINGVMQQPMQLDTQERCEKLKTEVNAVVFGLSEAKCYATMIPTPSMRKLKWEI